MTEVTRYLIVHHYRRNRLVMFSCYMTKTQLRMAREYFDDLSSFERGTYKVETVYAQNKVVINK